jgi:hypothetical protein
MLAWKEDPSCYEMAMKAEAERLCPTAWWFWIAAALTTGAVIFQRQKRKRGK